MHDYKPNSHRFKAEQKAKESERKKTNKVIHGSVKTKKKTKTHKLVDIFLPEDINDVKSYLIYDVIIPGVKDGVFDALKTIFYGRNSGKRKAGNYVSYRDYSSRDSRPSDRDRQHKSDFDELIFESRGEAQMVLDHLKDIVDQYGLATVSDMFDLAGERVPYTANRYGWTQLRTAEVIRVRDGYIIKTPKASPID